MSIKFRSWNIDWKQFIFFEDGKYSVELNGDFVTIAETSFYLFKWNGAEQRTLFKDKNNKEIYQGDILVECGVICGFVNKDMCIEQSDGTVDEYLIDLNFAKIKVVGNIHEDRDLLLEL